MRMLPLAGLALSAVLVLTGCVSPRPLVMPTSVPTSTPVFASDEEALAAATAAYAEYLRVEDLIAQDGGAKPERLKDLVTAEWFKVELAAFSKFAKTGLRQVGESSFRNATFQSASASSEAPQQVVIYVCADTSKTRFVKADGSEVPTANRVDNLSLEVSFLRTNTGPLQLDGNQPWSGESVC
jgi:hypothetical protein